MPRKIPTGVWMLGLVSLFMDMSSEMSHAILPLFLTGTLGASVAMVGLIDGVAEALAQFVKLFSGVLSDRAGSRKWLAVAGYGLSAVTKPLFPLAASAGGVLAARLADRVGKGIRGPPRDAMVADLAPPELRGAAFGLRQALDTVGAFLGPLIAVALLWGWAMDLRSILWAACIPALLAVLVLVLGVAEPERAADGRTGKSWRDAFRLANPGRAFWLVLAIGVAMSAARLTEAFLVLKAQASGWPVALVPLVMVLMSLFYFAAVYPAGVLADRFGTRGLLVAGILALMLAELLLAATSSLWGVIAGVCIWGLHMGLTQGLLGKMVADAAPPDLRGTCFGYFNLGSGVATLAAGLAAGVLWDISGPAAAFSLGVVLGAACLLLLLLVQPRLSIQ